ncbi:MAG: 50S ribosomal protein L4 [Candidatus Marinimicrobia bacterium]|jgi:large subunit ribosomal protein L4|nr:50S ribosomal protein L4 [Candidatus Neomarinimicrobiota bacterium]MBT3948223.1 50S ribosomal protein L4 [Candidatus Neomarinimicrobiota bacterium]MBT4064265.1 50S ribosomal protein L4 [Candidatus Neomarinimicrobiota bacterium]MBT4308523.1 50S ribosomal protein L4 [Candidatus Neomarinimicrobiota bacterium]MBT4452554.1 50S ribosomal protein L4 [Candidatus Neomarinimicrobiota bacterium]|tara:strand:- start:15752 stop:16384 length:633 start_codon:yes stop_codon:yes gene_type:complete
MKLNIIKQNGGKGSTVTVDDSVFAIKPNESVVHQAVVAELANSRQGTHASKNRSAVRGGGKKPWKQKGRGVARAGTTRSPLWKGGGVVFGPEPHKYEKRMPKKMRRLARRSVLSKRANAGELIVIDAISMSAPKTKEFVSFLSELDLLSKKVTIMVASYNDNVFLAARNLSNVYVVEATSASTYDLLDCEVLLIEKAGLALLNEQLMVKS